MSDQPTYKELEQRIRGLEKNEVEKKLKESEDIFQSIFEGSKDGMILGNRDGNFFRASAALSELLGWSEQELLSMKTSKSPCTKHKSRQSP